jgi:NAD(P)-dependent dehydrogenase (short-subunit alcohol dehydrogenase family)
MRGRRGKSSLLGVFVLFVRGGVDVSGDRLPRVTAHYGDVSDPESVDGCIAEILAAHGKIDNLVTSAGFTENFEATAYPIDRMRKLWGVNVDGTYLFATAIARHLVSLFLSLFPCFDEEVFGCLLSPVCASGKGVLTKS